MNHENAYVSNTGTDEAAQHTESIRGLNLAAVRLTTFQVTNLPS